LVSGVTRLKVRPATSTAANNSPHMDGLQKPIAEEYEVSEAGMRHRPTDERFIPYPGKPTDGSWRDGHAIGAKDYDQEEVRTLGRKLWAKYAL
jgi:hypothetical protein